MFIVKRGGYKKNELSDAHKSKVQMIRESQVIEAKNEEIAKQIHNRHSTYGRGYPVFGVH